MLATVEFDINGPQHGYRISATCQPPWPVTEVAKGGVPVTVLNWRFDIDHNSLTGLAYDLFRDSQEEADLLVKHYREAGWSVELKT